MHFLGISVVEFEEVNVGWGRSTIGFTFPVDHVTLLKGASRQFLFLTSSLISASKKPMFVIRKININEIVKAVLQIMSVCSINLDIFFFLKICEGRKHSARDTLMKSHSENMWEGEKGKNPCRTMISVKFQRVVIFLRTTVPGPRTSVPALSSGSQFCLLFYGPRLKLLFRDPHVSN